MRKCDCEQAIYSDHVLTFNGKLENVSIRLSYFS